MTLQRAGFLWLPSSWLRDDWLLSRVTAKVFLSAAVCIVALIPVFEGWVSSRNFPGWFQLPWTIIGMVISAGIVFLMLGMWRYWIRIDDSPRAWKRLWFFVLLFGFAYGSTVYCFFVYMPQLNRQRARGV